MTSTHLVKFAVHALLSAGVVLASGSFQALSALAAEARARIGTVAYDRTNESLLLPVSGAAPAVAVRRLAPRQYVADFTNCELARDEIQGQRLTSRLLAGWSLSETGNGDKVVLRLTLNEDVQPQFRFSPQARGMVVSFPAAEAKRPVERPAVVKAPPAAAQPGMVSRVVNFVGSVLTPRQAAQPTQPAAQSLRRASAPAPAKAPVKPQAKAPAKQLAKAPAAKKPHASKPAARRVAAPAVAAPVATFGVPRFDARAGLLVIPVAGRLKSQPFAAVRLNSRWAYLDVVGGAPAFGGVRYGHPGVSAFERWVMAKRPGRDVTRFSFALSAAADISVQSTPGALLVSVKPKTMVLGQAPAPARAAAIKAAPLQLAGRSLVSRPYFDESRFGLVIPYVGETPRFRWEKRGDRRTVLALKGRLNAGGVLDQRFKLHPVMAGWRMAPRAGSDVVELALDFSRSAELVIAADPARRQLLLIPQPRLEAAEAEPAMAPGGAKTVLAEVERDQRSQYIYIPFNGAAPAYTVEQVSPTFAYVAFAASRMASSGVTFHAPERHASVNYWLCSERPRAGQVRLALSLSAPAAPRVYEDRERQRLVVVLDQGPAVGMMPARTGPRAPEPWAIARPQAQPSANLSRRVP